ncbi:MAG: DUF1905 domain-containing protein [Longimicrobiales bacterium]
MKKTFTVTIVREGSTCFIPVPFDPRTVFGKARAPVNVTLNGYTNQSTIASMGDGPCIPLRRSSRERAAPDCGPPPQTHVLAQTPMPCRGLVPAMPATANP